MYNYQFSIHHLIPLFWYYLKEGKILHTFIYHASHPTFSGPNYANKLSITVYLGCRDSLCCPNRPVVSTINPCSSCVYLRVHRCCVCVCVFDYLCFDHNDRNQYHHRLSHYCLGTNNPFEYPTGCEHGLGFVQLWSALARVNYVLLEVMIKRMNFVLSRNQGNQYDFFFRKQLNFRKQYPNQISTNF